MLVQQANTTTNKTPAVSMQQGVTFTDEPVNSNLQSTVDNNNASLSSTANQAKQSGVNVQTSTPKQVSSVSDANADYTKNKTALNNAMQQQNTYNQQYQNAQNQYNADQATAKQETNNFTDYVNNAKKSGINVTVNQKPVIVNNVDALKKDYSNQQASIDNAIKTYNTEVQKVNADNTAIDNSNAALKAKYQQDESTYQKQMDEYNQQMQQYQQSQKIMQGKLNASGINTADLKQELNWGRSPNATLTVTALNPNLEITKIPASDDSFDKNYVGWDSQYAYLIHNKTNTSINGPFAKLTYAGNLDLSYKGKKIATVVLTLSNLDNNNGNLNLTNLDTGDPSGKTKLLTPYVRVGNDPTDNLWYGNCKDITENYDFYDANGKLINFDNDAYITVGSLNAYNNHLEEAQLLSAGKAIALAGSNIGVHPNNTLYSNGDQEDQSKWDKNSLTTGNAYYGAGVFQVNGDHITIKLSVDRTYKSTKLGPDCTASMTKDNHPGVWALIGTTLPTTPNVPTPPKAPQAPSYKNHEPKPTNPTVDVHYDELQEKQPVLSHATVTYNLDNAESGSSTIKYVNSKTGQEMPNLPEKATSGVSGSSYKWDEPQVPGYTVSKVEGNLTGTYVGGKTTQTIIYYTPVVSKGSADVKYINSVTGQEMPNLPSKTSEGNVGDTYKWDEPQVPGYTISKVEGNLTGKYVKGQPSHTVVYYTPIQQKGSADVKYINTVTGQEMPNLPVKTSEGNVGDTYKWDEPQVPGYTISKVEGSLTGKYVKGQPSHTVVYYTPVQQTGTADVKYVNALTGQEMPGLPAENSQGNVGTSYSWNEPQVPGYKVSKVEGNLNGKYIKGHPSHTVVYYMPIKSDIQSEKSLKYSGKNNQRQLQEQHSNIINHPTKVVKASNLVTKLAAKRVASAPAEETTALVAEQASAPVEIAAPAAQQTAAVPAVKAATSSAVQSSNSSSSSMPNTGMDNEVVAELGMVGAGLVLGIAAKRLKKECK